jgi:dihydropteroate synthase
MSGPRPPGHPLVMGIVNVTPDSFSDGGRYANTEAAVAAALALIEAGADMLDVGGESTRPGAEPVGEAEELDRTIPVVEAIAKRTPVPISIDTMKPVVAEAAMAAGARLWNDVNALRAPGAVETAAKLQCGVVLMHMRGEPRTMQASPQYEDVLREVGDFLESRVDAVCAAGVTRERLWIDLGIGFGKSPEHNLRLIKHLAVLKSRLELPLLFGASRKRFIGALDPKSAGPLDRLGGSLAAAVAAACAGADIIRVHDVRETVQALTVAHAIQAAA